MKDIQLYVLHLSPMLDLETLLTNIFLEHKAPLLFLKVHPHKEKHKEIFLHLPKVYFIAAWKQTGL